MRSPRQIEGLEEIQIKAYYKSFLWNLDEHPYTDLSDWECSFCESALHRCLDFTKKQEQVIEELMLKFRKIYPTYAHYNTVQNAEKFITMVCK